MKNKIVPVGFDRTVTIFGKINHETMKETIVKVMGFFKEDPNGEIKLIICSGGGMCDPSFMFIDMVRTYKINLTTIGSGGVGSMAVLIFAAGAKRFATKHTDFFLHDFGYSSDREERLSTKVLSEKFKNLTKSQRWYVEFIEEQTGGKFKVSRALKLMKTETYLYPDELIKLGLVHKII